MGSNPCRQRERSLRRRQIERTTEELGHDRFRGAAGVASGAVGEEHEGLEAPFAVLLDHVVRLFELRRRPAPCHPTWRRPNAKLAK